VRLRRGALAAELMRAQPAATPSVMAWTSSMSLVVCGLYVAVATALRSGPGHGAAPFGVALAAVVAGGLVILGHRRFRTWHYHLLQPGTGAAVALGVHLDGGGASSAADASLFVVLASLASFFFPWTTAAVHLAVNTSLLVVTLSAAPGVGAGDVVVLACTTVTSGVLVGVLSRVTAKATAVAELDVLTGLPNRRGTGNRLTAALAAHRGGAPLSLAVLDLDHFKQVNDTLGHAAGDDLLRRAAVGWSALLPPSAVLGRWGGDEFVLVARLDPAGAADLTDRMRSALPPGRSCTAGVTGLAVGDDLDTALSRADQGLYAAKRAGRGRTAVWTPALADAQPWLESQPSIRSDSGSSGSSTPDSSGASSPSMPTAAS